MKILKSKLTSKQKSPLKDLCKSSDSHSLSKELTIYSLNSEKIGDKKMFPAAFNKTSNKLINCKNQRSKSSPNCLVDYGLNESLDNNLKTELKNSLTNENLINDQQQFHAYDLRRKKNSTKTKLTSKDDNLIKLDCDQLFSESPSRSTNSSPNLNYTKRKKQRKLCSSCSTNHLNFKIENSNHLLSNLSNGDDFISKVPDEILLKIFSYLKEVDLCNVSLVSKKFYKISNDIELWKRLYQDLYEYDLPLIKDENCKFKFIVPEEGSNIINPWKRSFKQFYKSIHVYETDIKPLEILVIKLANSFPKSNDKLNLNNLNKLSKEKLTDQIPTVFIHKGIYKPENLLIEVDLNLIGAASGPVNLIAKQVIIENSEKSTIHFTNGVRNSYLGYVTLLCKSKETCPNSSQPYNALIIDKKSKPKIFNCIIESNCKNGAAICVLGKGTEPEISNCEISDCANVGFFIDSYARGFYSSNLITGSNLAAIWVKNGADPVFRNNTIAHGKDVGIFCFDNALGLFESNNIYNNRIAGLEVKGNSNPTVIRNSIHHGQTGGIYCHEGGRGQFIENKIYANNFAGIWICGNDTNPTIKSNEIYNGLQGGIYIFSNGKGVIESNNIHGNNLAGIQIRTGSEPIVRYNKIHSGMHGGIYCHEKSKGLIEHNEIYENKLAGIWITTESKPIIRSNRIYAGKQVGVYFYDNGMGVLENNEIFDHLYSGIQIRTGSDPLIKKNKIWGGKNGGILIYNGGLSTISGNEIFDNNMANIWIKSDSNPTLIGNKIYGGKENGVCIFNGAKGILKKNDIFKNFQAGVLISSSQSDVLLKQNRIYANSAGVEITNNGFATLLKNQIFNNKFGGICLATNVNPILKENQIFDNENEIEKTINSGQCLYKISSWHRFPVHEFYRCTTCKTTAKNAICKSCIKSCHKDHEIEYIRFDRFFCDCGSGTLNNQCKLIETTQETDTLYDSAAPIESKLYPVLN